ncbi:hypothetical protein QTP86_022932 [Hemibagrus guttatus]|nr:hypothetical protein QTP86_022932 [Hemibagrus guttatus]
MLCWCEVESEHKSSKPVHGANKSKEQVTTLVNTSNKGPSSKKKGRSKKAHVLALSVEQATQNFLEKGEQIAKDSQDLTEELITAVEEVRKQGDSMRVASSEFADDPCSSVKRGTMVRAARALLSAVTRLLILADMADVMRLLAHLKIVEEALEAVKNATNEQDLANHFKEFGKEMVKLNYVAARRQQGRSLQCQRTGKESPMSEDREGVSNVRGEGRSLQCQRTGKESPVSEEREGVSSVRGQGRSLQCQRRGKESPVSEDREGVSSVRGEGRSLQCQRTGKESPVSEDREGVSSVRGEGRSLQCQRTGKESPVSEEREGVSSVRGQGRSLQCQRRGKESPVSEDREGVSSVRGQGRSLQCQRRGKESPVSEDREGVSSVRGEGRSLQCQRTGKESPVSEEREGVSSVRGQGRSLQCQRTGKESPVSEEREGVSSVRGQGRSLQCQRTGKESPVSEEREGVSSELKDPQCRDEMAAARGALKKNATMLYTASQAFLRHPDVAATRANRDYVFKQVQEAIGGISSAAQATSPTEEKHGHAGIGELAAALNEFDRVVYLQQQQGAVLHRSSFSSVPIVLFTGSSAFVRSGTDVGREGVARSLRSNSSQRCSMGLRDVAQQHLMISTHMSSVALPLRRTLARLSDVMDDVSSSDPVSLPRRGFSPASRSLGHELQGQRSQLSS